MAQPAGLSSSSSFTCEWTYDVFISFRGEDTRNTFTGSLYNSLVQKGIYAFIDEEELGRGEQIRPALLKAIRESRIAIIVFSKNYAESTFCLDELVEILEHLKATGRLVWPIFYDVDPSEVRHRSGGSYAEALAKLEERFRDDKGKVQKWRDALREAADLSGSHFKPGSETEYKFIDIIVSEISKKLNHTPLHVADKPVGLESPVLKVKSLIGLGSNDRVDMVGIWGTGGIGKTTIARAVYNSFVDQFNGSCFLAGVREDAEKHGLAHLQETLLSEILGEDIKVRDVNKGISLIKRRLQRKKILLILDDVDDREQLKAIAGGHDWFGFGTRVIITSRDRHLLGAHGVKKFYEVKELNKQDALELFSWSAFGSNKVDPNYADVLSRALSYVGGLPLALEVIGSNLHNTSIDEWNSALDKYERIPNTKVDKILKVSYDGLEEDEKNVFLDIACFFNKYKSSDVKEMLHARGFHPEHSIRVLIHKSLMKIDYEDCVRMHDLIQDMGREIVRQESTSNPGKRSRLWFDEDILRVLQNDMGTAIVEVICLSSRKRKKVHWNGNAFKKMRNLRALVVRNAHFSVGPEHLPNTLRVLDWNGYPSPFLPSDFYPNELSILRLRHSCIKLDEPLEMFVSLVCMDFKGCEFLVQVPNLSGLPNLKELCLDNCTNLIKVDDSTGSLDKLVSLTARRCIKLHTLVPAINLPSLKDLDLRGCTGLQRFPEVLGVMENVRELWLEDTAIEELPDSISNLVGLRRLDLRGCRYLSQLPESIELLPEVWLFLSPNQRGFRPNEPDIVQQAVEFRGLRCRVEVVPAHFIVTFVPPSPFWSKVQIIGRGGSPVCFWFRERFPGGQLDILPEPRGKRVAGSAFVLSISVLVNGTFQFNTDQIYYNSAACLPHCFTVNAGYFLRELPLDIEERMFSLQEWNHAEISCELKCHMPYFLPKWVSGGKRTTIAAVPIKQSIFNVFRHGYCMKDLIFLDGDGQDSTCTASCYCNYTSS